MISGETHSPSTDEVYTMRDEIYQNMVKCCKVHFKMIFTQYIQLLDTFISYMCGRFWRKKGIQVD